MPSCERASLLEVRAPPFTRAWGGAARERWCAEASSKSLSWSDRHGKGSPSAARATARRQTGPRGDEGERVISSIGEAAVPQRRHTKGELAATTKPWALMLPICAVGRGLWSVTAGMRKASSTDVVKGFTEWLARVEVRRGRHATSTAGGDSAMLWLATECITPHVWLLFCGTCTTDMCVFDLTLPRRARRCAGDGVAVRDCWRNSDDQRSRRPARRFSNS